jgi:hypothetical protein
VTTFMTLVRKLWLVGGWAPLLVFALHVVASRGLNAYVRFPPTDIPMHFAGGVAIAFFISGCFRALPRDADRSSRVVVLEGVLVGSLATTAALLWEFAEFSIDRLVGTNIQVSLNNTMQDLALGMLGALVLVIIRARQLRVAGADIREVASEWMSGELKLAPSERR